MNDYISKPFEEEELINAIARWLGDSPETFNTLQSSAMESKPAAPLYDLKKLENIAQNNRAFVLKMINLFCRQAPGDVTEIEMALRKQDLNTVRSVAHRMKPSIDNMGIESLHTLIREVELYQSGNDTITADLTNNIAQLRSTIEAVVEQLQAQELQAAE
jgi:HPt (histidine-containing phosphotransfer) domain-containing protein